MLNYITPVMYLDPSGESFILACIIIGGLIGGGLAYKHASEAGYQGEDLIAFTMLGVVGGAAIGYLSALYIPLFLQSSFTFGLPILSISGSSLAINIATVSVTGTQVIGVATLSLSGYMFARTSKKNGYYVEKHLNDHVPDHAHLKGQDGTNIRIDKSGNPIKNEGPLSGPQRKAIKQLLEEIAKLFQYN